MELYIAPPDNAKRSRLTREEALAALGRARLEVRSQQEQAGTTEGCSFWTIAFVGSDVSLQFQETSEGLVFATLEQSMFDNSEVPDSICAALEAVGWQVDAENVG